MNDTDLTRSELAKRSRGTKYNGKSLQPLPFKHGFCSGRRQSRLWSVWAAMKQRCQNPNNKGYHNYGGRGIAVCEEWLDFQVFHKWASQSGYRVGLTLDRIDNDAGYNPTNCRWVNRTEQNRNTRRARAIVRSDGLKFPCAAVAAEATGCPKTSITAVCRGRQKSAGGFVWSYASMEDTDG